MSLKSLGRKLRASLKKIVRRSDKRVTLAASVVLENLVLSTPVQTGEARSGWTVSIGSPSSEVPNPSNPSSADLGGEHNNAASTITAGRAVIDKWSSKQGSLFIQNNVPYIEKLADGASQQAPEGWVEDALEAGRRILK